MKINGEASINKEKQIAKNTIMLYFRIFVTLCLSFFTTRVLLLALGVESFGTVSLISGIVTILSFLSSAISGASARFFNVELGRKNYKKLRELFSITLYIYLILIGILFVLCETIGAWVFYNKLNIPASIFIGAKYFFHFTILTFLLNILSIPYNAIVLSRENMGFIAFESVSVSILKLAIAYLLYIENENRIALYGFLLVVVAVVRFLGYFFYCFRFYSETKPMLYWNNRTVKELIVFSWWNIFGVFAGMLNGAILNVILNNFFGTGINTARSIATQVSGGVSSFAQNFILATNPQIIKNWSMGDIEKSKNLTIIASKYAYFLILILALPILIKTEIFLKFWLTDIPSFSVIFTRLLIVQILIDVISYPLMSLFQATGRIALYQVIVSFTILLNLPISYILLKYGYSPQCTLWGAIIISLVCVIERIFLIKVYANLSKKTYIKRVIMPIIVVSIICAIASIQLSMICIDSLIGLILLSIASIFSTLLAIFLFGMSKQERDFVIKLIQVKLRNTLSRIITR